MLASTVSGASLAEYIESDAETFVSVRSLADSRVQWEAHPFAEILEDESMQAFIDSFGAEDGADADGSSGFTTVMKDEFGLTWDDFTELFPGEIALVFYNLTDAWLSTGERNQVVLMAEFSGDSDRMNELMQIQFERNAEAQKEINPLMEHTMIEESFMGETLHMDEAFDGEETYIEDGYALVNGIFILGTEERLRSAVELIKDGGDSIVKSDAYRRALEESGRGDLRIYMNLSELLGPLNEMMTAKVMEGGLAMFGVTAQSLESALSLRSMQAAFVDFDLVEEGALSHSGLIYSEQAGLLRLLTYGDDGLPAATYVPEGVLATTVSTFNFGAMLSELEQVLTLASPSVPMLLDIQLQQLKTTTGVDFRNSILENIGGDVVSLSVLKETTRSAGAPRTEQVYVMQVKDAQALSQALEALKDMVPGLRDMIETQEYEGQTIHTFKAQPNQQQPDAGDDISYVITRSDLIVNIGRVGLLQEVLSNMAASGRGFWQMAETESLFESIERVGPVTRSYLDLEQMVKPLLTSILRASSMGGMGTGVDLSKLPTNLEMPLHLISEGNIAEDGYFTRAFILKREVAE